MANKYYGLPTSELSSWLASLAEALMDKYGDLVTINKVDASNIIFTCPSISERAIRIVTNYVYCGSASGASFTSQATFFYEYNASVRYLPHLVLGDSFLLLTGVGTLRETILIAKTRDGVSLFFGAVGNNSSYYINNNRWIAAKDGEDLGEFDIIHFGCSCMSGVGVPYKSPIILKLLNSQGDQILRNGWGEPDTIDGLYMSLYSPANPKLVNGGLFAATELYSVGGAARLRTSLLAEF